MLLNILIIFFSLLIAYQIFLANKIIEGVENCSSNDPAGKAYILSLETKSEIDKTNKKVYEMEKQIQELAVANKEMAQSLPGAGGPVVSNQEVKEEETF